MNFDKKFSIFLEVAEMLNKNGIIPTLYGSLGLYRLIGQLDEIDDIDIVVPELYLKENFSELKNIMGSIGYRQDKTFPHEFNKGEGQIGFESDIETHKYAESKESDLEVTKIKGITFKEFKAQNYLIFYKKIFEEHVVKQRKKELKIKALKELLKKGKENNFAFIDSQNLNLNIRNQGWILDFARFHRYLKEKYSVNKAFLFVGYVEDNKKLYDFLTRTGYVCIFKPTLEYQDGSTKGNCDAELVLQAMIELQNYDKALIISGDGDFHCLVKYLLENNKLGQLLIPNRYKFSALLKFKIFRPYLRYMNDLRDKLSYKKEKAPQGQNLEG